MDLLYECPSKPQSDSSTSVESKASVGCVSTTTSRIRVTASKQQQLLFDFQLIYEYLCKGNNGTILRKITSGLAERKLDFIGDRIKLEHWGCILEALRLDRSLHVIAIRSRYQNKVILDNVDNEGKARKVIATPPLYTKHIFQSLIASLRETLDYTTALTCLELEGLPLTTEYLAFLMEGVSNCRSLQNLSLYRSNVGDAGVEIMCPALKRLPNIVFLDLTGCGVTEIGAFLLADLIKYQNLQRFGEGWKQNLRYRTVNVDEFPGLRRLTINHNPLVGDCGFRSILENLKDDVWIKAVDAQNCGLTSNAANHVLETLETNTSLRVVDLRGNEAIYADQLTTILNALARNDESMTRINNYTWLNLETNIRPKQMPSRPSTCQSCPHSIPGTASQVRTSDLRRARVVHRMDKFGKNLDELLSELQEERTRCLSAHEAKVSVQDKMAAALREFNEERAKRISVETELSTLLLVKEKVMQEAMKHRRSANRSRVEIAEISSPRPSFIRKRATSLTRDKPRAEDSSMLKPWSYTLPMGCDEQEDLSKIRPWTSYMGYTEDKEYDPEKPQWSYDQASSYKSLIEEQEDFGWMEAGDTRDDVKPARHVVNIQ